MFTAATDLNGTWTRRDINTTLSLHSRLILMTGLELTAARKLYVASQRLITAAVPEYEFSSSAVMTGAHVVFGPAVEDADGPHMVA